MTDRLVDANDDSDILGEVGEGKAMQDAQGESAQAAAARCPAVQMRTDVMPTNVFSFISHSSPDYARLQAPARVLYQSSRL